MTTSPAAREIGIAAGTLKLWADNEKVPCLKTTDGRRLFRRSDIERLKEARAAAKKNGAGSRLTA